MFYLGAPVIDTSVSSFDEDQWFMFSNITVDDDQVSSLLFVSYNRKDGLFKIDSDQAGNWFIWVSTSIGHISGGCRTFEVPLYFDYIDADGKRRNALETFYVYAYESGDNMPSIKYIENVASRVGEAADIVIHGKNLNTNLSVVLIDSIGECYTIYPDEIKWDIENDTASFTLLPNVLSVDADGTEMCGMYSVALVYGDCNTLNWAFQNEYGSNIGIIRYKYDDSNESASKNSTASVGNEEHCYSTNNMTLVYDDSNPNQLGDTIYIKRNPGIDCTEMQYYRIRLKYNENLSTKRGEKVLNGTYLLENDIVWLASQVNIEENGLWVVKQGDWVGLGELVEPSEYNPCSFTRKPLLVDDYVFIDLGAKVTYDVDVVCSDNVTNRYGKQTVCCRLVEPGDVVALTNQADGGNGLWLVSCADWYYLGLFDSSKDNTVDLSSQIIVQNDIDFCKCGIYHIDYYYMNPSCFMTHLRRTVKLICGAASIAPNNVNQFVITDYVIRTEADDSLVSNTQFTPGDPVKEDCVLKNEEPVVDSGMEIVEMRPDDYEPEIIIAPDGTPWCDVPRFYNIKMGLDYTSSNDSNGFTILFWRYENNGWHLYAYIGSGSSMLGISYSVLHLHVSGMATAQTVDVNKDYWFTRNGGVIADGDNGFVLEDDSLVFVVRNSERQIEYTTHNLTNDNFLMQSWRVKCTANIFGFRPPEIEETKMNTRTTCDDMNNPQKTELARETIQGTLHIYGFNYYKHAMSIDEFVSQYNKYSDTLRVHKSTQMLDIGDSGNVMLDVTPFEQQEQDRWILKV